MKKKNKKKKFSFKEFINSTKTLTTIFILLLVLVIFLIVLCVNKSKEADNNKFANMIIPVYELNTDYDFTINAKILSETDEYVFKIVNYKKEELNKESIPYQIEIVNDTNSIIKVTKDDSKKDLMVDQKQTIIEGKKLSNKEKENIYYHVKITEYNDLTSKDLISIKITN